MAVEQLMEEDTILQNCQRQLGHQLPLSSYLLKPVQRLTKYQLLLKVSLELRNNSLFEHFVYYCGKRWNIAICSVVDTSGS